MHESTRSLLDAHLAQAQHDHRVPSMTAALLRDGRLVWSHAAGHLDGRGAGPRPTAQTAYRIGSISKTFAAALAMRLVADGLVDLDDPVTDHLPELDPSLRTVTITALLTHGAGLYAETRGPWWERTAGDDWAALLPSIRRIHPVGRRFHYSNVGFAVLGELVARLRERPWWDCLTDEVLTPLGLEHTTYLPPGDAAPGLAVHPYADLAHAEPAHDAGAMAPAGQLWSTVGDLTAWAHFLARGNDGVLPDELRLAMQVPSLVDDAPGSPWTRAYGLGLDVTNRGGTRLIGHGGSMPGFLAALRVEPGSGDGVALLANTTGNLDLDLAIELLDLLQSHEPRAVEEWVTDPAQTGDLDVAGAWFWGPRPHVLSLLPGGGVELAPAGSGRGSRFAPVGDGSWIGLDEYYAGEHLVVRDRGGDAAYLDLGSFRFSRTPYDPNAHTPGGTDPSGWH
ncbi:serine hydrolase domain-containing protein [Leekyejoonella antrihumi]|uniref:Beta-lactamase family protein n=1 Tax=Leekyejoonella antrihumi TaxID=1660198 RepID=A0A563E092_9MICO|nr:serine hydrolase domain-containing protein [Leekyejoonella antrihumi]TWP35968.1 beta-lactamase family protein [Leekyejoonella antrihumi]